MNSATHTVGSFVTLSPAFVALFECYDLSQVIHQVTDARHAGNGKYTLTVAPVTATGVDYSRISRGLSPSDLCSVRA